MDAAPVLATVLSHTPPLQLAGRPPLSVSNEELRSRFEPTGSVGEGVGIWVGVAVGIAIVGTGVETTPLLTVTFKAPLQVDYKDTAENILAQLMDSIEQSKEYMMKGAHHWITEPA